MFIKNVVFKTNIFTLNNKINELIQFSFLWIFSWE